MADFTSTQSTVIDRTVFGNKRLFTLEITAFTTAVAADTVVTPLTAISWAVANWQSSAALGTNTLNCAISTASPGSIVLTHSTHNNLPVQVTVFGR